jgi:probable rRNA maturation factor
VIEVVIEDPAWTAVLPNAGGLVAAAAEAALREGPPPCAPVDDGAADLVVLLTDDAAVQALNARFREKDAPTNVLSFPAPPNPEGHLGDVALAYGVCAREAAEQHKALEHHLQHLVVHGVLHLLGYDHMSDDEAEAMEGLERIVLAGLGAPDPYQADRRDHD